MDTSNSESLVDVTGELDEPAAQLACDGAVAILRLNRPKALNAVNAALSSAVGEAIERFEADPKLRVLIITGNGRAFCAGADLKQLAAGEDVHAPEHPEWGFAGFVQHVVTKPVIAAVNGVAFGGGTEIVLACDLVVMSDEASLGLPEVKRGLFAAAGGVINLQKQLPTKRAAEYVLTGDPITPADALAFGLVNRVVPAAGVLPAARELADRIAANGPVAVAASKKLMGAASGAGTAWVDDVWALNGRLQSQVFASDDAREGALAFADKRAPRWSGR